MGSSSHLPSNSAHLRVILEENGGFAPCTARLWLWTAARIIYVEQTAADALTAYDLSIRALLGELNASFASGEAV